MSGSFKECVSFWKQTLFFIELNDIGEKQFIIPTDKEDKFVIISKI